VHPPIVRIVGRSNVGKTTLIERLIPSLRARGLRLAVIKHDVHGFDIDHPGKDTWRFSQAQAEAVLLGSAGRFVLMERTPVEWTLEELAELLAGRVDLVLTEGYKRTPHPKIEVARAAVGEPLCRPEELWALVSAESVPGYEAVPRYASGDHEGVARLIMERVGLDGSVSKRVELERWLADTGSAQRPRHGAYSRRPG
jgi:molybdopterin-guanine dinucleotide biosynthesis protein B